MCQKYSIYSKAQNNVVSTTVFYESYNKIVFIFIKILRCSGSLQACVCTVLAEGLQHASTKQHLKKKRTFSHFAIP